MSHLGDRVAALVDGELPHDARDRALAHLAHCPQCRDEVEAQRGVKHLLRHAPSPDPVAQTVTDLLSLSSPGGPLPPRARSMPLGPLVPHLAPPGRTTRATRTRAAHRGRLVAAGALSMVGLVLGTAFAAGGSTPAPVVPPVAELSVEHGRTSTAVTLGDPGLGLMTGYAATSTGLSSTGAGSTGAGSTGPGSTGPSPTGSSSTGFGHTRR